VRNASTINLLAGDNFLLEAGAQVLTLGTVNIRAEDGKLLVYEVEGEVVPSYLVKHLSMLSRHAHCRLDFGMSL
jgi:hypothetical protein